MPSTLNIKIICSRFWPYSGSTQLSVRDLGVMAQQNGHQVEVLTAGWDKSQPTSFQFLNFQVRRFHKSTSQPWGSFYYQKQLKRHLAQTQPDRIIFIDAHQELTPLIKAFSGQIPIVVRLYDHQVPSRIQDIANHSRHTPLKRVDRLLVESETTIDSSAAFEDDTKG